MSRIQFRLMTLLSVLCAVAVLCILVLSSLNRGLQEAVGARQQYVQQSAQLEGLYREIVRALAELGARNNDVQVRDMLARHGITYSTNAPAAPTPAASPRK